MNDQTPQAPATTDGAASVLTVGLAGDAEKERSRCIVRLRTATWADSKGLHIKRSLTYLRRQCVGFTGLEEDAGAVGAEQTIASITNLDQCEDGIYEAVVCNVSRDWETGYADDWDYKLVPISTANAELRRVATGAEQNRGAYRWQSDSSFQRNWR